ncbi:hypothetical protein JK364_23805 [Streptomyces sp. 110]|uniref:Uncharacterized protein n=1 Tax=Streptomyces endocoffeicus TaxID=2898945 RepID=A0ABS1PSJ2_9ACTN|nr:hypothetical protein [Streptomyces endocoffeicus]MBL1115400.1 hypothetical protein [Streptomyces endocoffeicus]
MKQVPMGFEPFGRRDLQILSRPNAVPILEEEEVLACNFIRADGLPDFNLFYVCETLEDMQHVYDSYYKGLAVRLEWFAAIEFNKILSETETQQWLKGEREI